MEIGGKLINPNLIEWVSAIHSFDNQFGFDVHFNSGKTLLFNFDSEEEAVTEWKALLLIFERKS